MISEATKKLFNSGFLHDCADCGEIITGKTYEILEDSGEVSYVDEDCYRHFQNEKREKEEEI